MLSPEDWSGELESSPLDGKVQRLLCDGLVAGPDAEPIPSEYDLSVRALPKPVALGHGLDVL